MVPNRRQSGGVYQSGRDPMIDRGQPQWSASWVTNELTAAEVGQWEAWRASLRGGQRYFIGHDPFHEYPQAYMPSGAGVGPRWDTTAFDWTGTLGAISTLVSARDGVDLYDLPSGFSMTCGDHVSFLWADSPAMNVDWSGGASSWTVTGGTFAASGGAMLLTPSSTTAKITSPTVTAFSGATFNRLYLDIETVSGPGTVAAIITLNGSVTFAAAFRVPANGKRTRQILDFSANATWLATTAITSVSIQPVSTNAGSYRFWAFRIDNGLPAAQRYSLHQVCAASPTTADASGKLAALWLEPELDPAIPVGAVADYWRANAKWKITEFAAPKSADGGVRPAVVSFKALSVRT